ncbi:DHH family phosphoesterase [Desulfosarcina cetonica]|uniref:DHH family phosphoesterase n=1 Tax=Desulfosarcina cetonica TaxID=90730 RepID=UPI001FF0292F|nr:hypothetical protein [Desulfosarcina cetonica]
MPIWVGSTESHEAMINDRTTLAPPLTIITSHVNADFDAMASMLAAQKLYPDAKVVFPGSQEKTCGISLSNRWCISSISSS